MNMSQTKVKIENVWKEDENRNTTPLYRPRIPDLASWLDGAVIQDHCGVWYKKGVDESDVEYDELDHGGGDSGGTCMRITTKWQGVEY